MNLRHGVYVESVTLGVALSAGEREILAMVAVANRGNRFIVLSPCGNCRQMLLDYAPEADVMFLDAGGIFQSMSENYSLLRRVSSTNY